MADASRALGAPQVAGAWVTRRGKAKRTMRTVAAAEIGGGLGAAVGAGKGSPQRTPETRANRGKAEQVVVELRG
jgi:hypothetical protein